MGTVAITGATGFVGAALTRRLAATGRNIQALVRPLSNRKRPSGIAVRWIDGDLEDTDSLRRLIHGADAVVHCAGAVRGATQAQFNRVNVDGTARLVKLLVRQHPTPDFLLISPLAAREPHLSPYAASKDKLHRFSFDGLAEVTGKTNLMKIKYYLHGRHKKSHLISCTIWHIGCNTSMA